MGTVRGCLVTPFAQLESAMVNETLKTPELQRLSRLACGLNPSTFTLLRQQHGDLAAAGESFLVVLLDFLVNLFAVDRDFRWSRNPDPYNARLRRGRW